MLAAVKPLGIPDAVNTVQHTFETGVPPRNDTAKRGRPDSGRHWGVLSLYEMQKHR
jgi:hypothetical protein